MPALLHRVTLPRPDNPAIVDAYVAAIEAGHPVATASTLAGISHDAATAWMHQGEAMLAEYPDTPAEELGSHAVFAVAVKQAEAAFVERNLQHVNGACAPDAKGWLPAMTLLERRRPQDFGRRDRAEVAVTVTHRLELPEAALASVLRLALQHALPQGETVEGEATELPTPQGE